jgi:glycosidase
MWDARRIPWGLFVALAIHGGMAPATRAITRAESVDASPEWAGAVLYFVMIDRFADGDTTNDAGVDRAAKGAFHGGDLKGLRDHLDEITDLGATAIWITPVVRNIPGFVTGAGFPDWAYHGYWADDFYALDPRFGTEEDLRGLVGECHRRGVRVLLDVVYNHAGYGTHYLTDPRTKDWLRSNETGSCGQDDLTLCVSGLPDWKTELPAVDDFLLNAHLGLAKRVGVDGFRLDTVKHVDHPFWDEHRRRTRAELGPAFFLLGEVWGGDSQVLDPWFAPDELDAGFDFGFQGSAIGFVQGRGRTVAFERYLESRQRTRPGHFLAHFLSTHDVPDGLSLLNGDKTLYRLAVVLQFTCIGIPVICWGDEVGRVGGDWPDNRADMPWGDRKILPGAGASRDEALRADYERLIAIRRAHPALWRGAHTGLSSTRDLLVFARRDSLSGEAVVVAVNRGATPDSARFALPPEWRGRAVADAWNGMSLPVAGDSVRIGVEARSARILVGN